MMPQNFTEGKVETTMPGTKGRKGQRLTARRRFEIYMETRGESAPVGEILRRWNVSLEQLRAIKSIVHDGAVQAHRARAGHCNRPQDATPEAFEQLRRELLTKERALAEVDVDLTWVEKGLSWGSTTDGPRSTPPLVISR